jgi:GTP-binding protein LepA
VLNKIDLPAANPDRVATEIENVIWLSKNDIICISWKTGQNVDRVLDAIIERIPSPQEHKLKNPKKFHLISQA